MNPTAGGSRRSSMQVPLWCLRHLFWPELRAGQFIRHHEGRSVFGEVEAVHVQFESTHFNIEVRGADLVVSLLNGKFKATYYKPTGRPHLILRERTRTDDHETVDEALGPQWQRPASWVG